MRRLIQAYLGGALSETDAERLRRHCRDCAPCAAALREAEGAARLVSSLSRPALPHDAVGDLLAQVRARAQERVGSRLLGSAEGPVVRRKGLHERASERWDAAKYALALAGFRVFAGRASLPAYAAAPVAIALLVLLYQGIPSPERVARENRRVSSVGAGSQPAVMGRTGAPSAGSGKSLPLDSADGSRAVPLYADGNASAAKGVPTPAAPSASSAPPAAPAGRPGVVADPFLRHEAPARPSAMQRKPQPPAPGAPPAPVSDSAEPALRDVRPAGSDAERAAGPRAAGETVASPGVAGGGLGGGGLPESSRPAPASAPAPGRAGNEMVVAGGGGGFGGGLRPDGAAAPGGGAPRERMMGGSETAPPATPRMASVRMTPPAPTSNGGEGSGGGRDLMVAEGVMAPKGETAPRAVPPVMAQTTASKPASIAGPAGVRPGEGVTATNAGLPSPAKSATPFAVMDAVGTQPLRYALRPTDELIRLLGGKPEDACDAARVLGVRREKGAVEALARLLQESGDAKVRQAAADALGAIATPPALAALRKSAETAGEKGEPARRVLDRIKPPADTER